MGCTNSKLQGDSFNDINADAKPISATRKAKPSYSTQPGRKAEGPMSTSETATLPTDDDAGIVSIAASPAGNWTADRERIRQDRSAYFMFKKQPTTREKSPYGGQATSNQAGRREEPKMRSFFA